jgi:hypothetical protein
MSMPISGLPAARAWARSSRQVSICQAPPAATGCGSDEAPPVATMETNSEVALPPCVWMIMVLVTRREEPGEHLWVRDSGAPHAGW